MRLAVARRLLILGDELRKLWDRFKKILRTILRTSEGKAKGKKEKTHYRKMGGGGEKEEILKVTKKDKKNRR